METITITERHECLPFSELDYDVQEKVMEQHGDWNVSHEWWEYVYDYFENQCKEHYGIEVDLKNTCFRDFYSQDVGAAFTGELTDIDCFLDRTNCPIAFLRVLRFMFNEMRLRMSTKPKDFYSTSQRVDFDRHGVNPHEDEVNQQDHYEHAEKALNWLENAWEEVCIDLASELYSDLEKEYEYMTSRVVLAETFDSYGYIFDTETGEMFNREEQAV